MPHEAATNHPARRRTACGTVSWRYGQRERYCEPRASRQGRAEIQRPTSQKRDVAGAARRRATTALLVEAANAGASPVESSRWLTLDADRFDNLLRGVEAGTRRGVCGVLAGLAVSAFAPLISLSDVDAKRRKKKKRRIYSPPDLGPSPSSPEPTSPPPTYCHGARSTCAGGCCQGLTCGDNGCDAAPVCCGKAGTACDQNCDCCGELTCRNGACGCPRNFDCGVECCDTGAETCVWSQGTCRSQICPVATDYCSDPETYLCADGCSCMTAMNGATVCSSMPDVCIVCSNDQNCAHMGDRAVCVKYDTRYCGNICQLPGPGMCVPGVCLDLPSGLVGGNELPIKGSDAGAASSAPQHTRSNERKTKQSSTRGPKKRSRHRCWCGRSALHDRRAARGRTQPDQKKQGGASRSASLPQDERERLLCRQPN